MALPSMSVIRRGRLAGVSQQAADVGRGETAREEITVVEHALNSSALRRANSTTFSSIVPRATTR